MHKCRLVWYKSARITKVIAGWADTNMPNSVSAFSHIHAWTMGGLSMMPATADFTIENPGPGRSPTKGLMPAIIHVY